DGAQLDGHPRDEPRDQCRGNRFADAGGAHAEGPGQVKHPMDRQYPKVDEDTAATAEKPQRTGERARQATGRGKGPATYAQGQDAQKKGEKRAKNPPGAPSVE